MNAAPPDSPSVTVLPRSLRVHGVLAVAGFVALNVYLNVPNLVPVPPWVWLGLYVGFFPLAHGVGRVTGAGGLAELGLALHRGWGRNLLLGLLFCLVLGVLKYALLWGLGAFQVEGLRPAGAILVLVLQSLLAMFLSSATDDVLLRGYLFRHLSRFLSAQALVALTTVAYVLNHVWYMHLTLESTVFLGLLGWMFALAEHRSALGRKPRLPALRRFRRPGWGAPAGGALPARLARVGEERRDGADARRAVPPLALHRALRARGAAERAGLSLTCLGALGRAARRGRSPGPRACTRPR